MFLGGGNYLSKREAGHVLARSLVRDRVRRMKLNTYFSHLPIYIYYLN